MKRLCVTTILLSVITFSFGQGGYRSANNSIKSSVFVSFEEQSQDIQKKWVRYTLTDCLERREKPPVDTVHAQAMETMPLGKHLQVSEVISVVDYAMPLETGTMQRRREANVDTSAYRNISFDFYGQPQSLLIPESLGSTHPSGITEEAVASFWQTLEHIDLSSIILEGDNKRRQYGINDWGVLAWVNQLSHTVFPQDRNSECTILSVYLLNQMGLMVRMARARDRLTTLFAAKQTIYGRKYVILDTYPFYLADPSIRVEEVYTYGNAGTMRTRPLDMRFIEPLRLGANSYKTVRKQSAILETVLEIPINMAVMNYYSNYPQLDVKEYALSRTDTRFKEELLASMRPILEGKTDLDAINLILRFLQKDFEYKIDIEQFGYEKPFFPEENFIYAYNDCEDRSILLSYLAWNLMHKKVVLLDYDDHLAAAISLNENITGDYVRIGSEKYYVCDPSYMNATVGVSIPQYRNRPVKVWVL